MRGLRRLITLLLLLALVLGGAGLFLIRRPFPQTDGELSLAGLQDRVEVVRDRWGIPHIYATNARDLFFAQGYTHAQERLWQMDFWRHIGQGRLSEMFGSSQIDADKFLRSLGFTALAEEELATMDPEARAVLEAYADGVNAYLAGRGKTAVSLEYTVLALQNPSYEIEPWDPVDTLTWAKVMSWDLSGNMRAEITRALLAADLPIERVEQLYPPYPGDHPVIIPAGARSAPTIEASSLPKEAFPALLAAKQGAEAVWALTGGGFEGIGSNNWVVDGSRTQSGAPLLANDPHLAIQMPSIWFANGLHCVGDSPDCPYQLAGFSFAGTPGVIIGHNDRIAWGVTSQAVDTQDLYIERVNPDNPNQYEIDGEWVDFQTRTEVLRVAGGDPVTFAVRSTRHGPVISGTFLAEGELDGSAAVELPENYVVTLAWQTLDPSTLVEAILGMNTAANHDEFAAAIAKWDIAAQNVVYADVEGNIAYHPTGEIPIRKQGDGRYPVPGWTSDYDWVGVLTPDRLPFMLNPPRGFIETANQIVLPPGSSPFIGIEGAYGYRADRIEDLLAESRSHTVESMQEIQLDARDGGAPNVVPRLLDIAPGGSAKVEEIQSWLRAWSEGSRAYQVRAESVGAAVYQATWRHLLANTFWDELPEDKRPTRGGGSRWFEVVRLLLEDPDDPWWDDITTPLVEGRDEILYLSMIEAFDELTALLGENPNEWTWGGLHTATFRNQTLGKSGIAPIELLFNRAAPPRVSGSTSVVNAIGWDFDKGYEVTWLPSMRMVIDLADLARSTFIHTTGQSGHAFAEHYDDMIASWTDGSSLPMLWERDQVMREAASTLVMVPADG
ncbi:MAG: penicillin acylase family protein [Acidimicrobiia bacterium]